MASQAGNQIQHTLHVERVKQSPDKRLACKRALSHHLAENLPDVAQKREDIRFVIFGERVGLKPHRKII